MTETEQLRAAHLANAAAEEIRSLNRCTHPGNGWPRLDYPSDFYGTLAALSRLADLLPPALRQVAAYLVRELRLERIAFDDDEHAGYAAVAVATVAHVLVAQASDAATQLAAALAAVQQAIASPVTQGLTRRPMMTTAAGDRLAKAPRDNH